MLNIYEGSYHHNFFYTEDECCLSIPQYSLHAVYFLTWGFKVFISENSYNYIHLKIIMYNFTQTFLVWDMLEAGSRRKNSLSPIFTTNDDLRRKNKAWLILTTFLLEIAKRQVQQFETAHALPLLEGRREMFYLTTHSTHFILRLYGVRHIVKETKPAAAT